MTALPEVAQGSLEEGLAKALLPHAQLRLFKGSVALLSAYAAGEINVFAGGGQRPGRGQGVGRVDGQCDEVFRQSFSPDMFK